MCLRGLCHHGEMAKTVIVKLTDDLDGSDADETIHFALDGTSYEIDVNAANAAELRDALKPFIAGGRVSNNRRSPSTARPTRAAEDKTLYSQLSDEEKSRFRAWASMATARRISDARVNSWVAAGKPYGRSGPAEEAVGVAQAHRVGEQEGRDDRDDEGRLPAPAAACDRRGHVPQGQGHAHLGEVQGERDRIVGEVLVRIGRESQCRELFVAQWRQGALIHAGRVVIVEHGSSCYRGIRARVLARTRNSRAVLTDRPGSVGADDEARPVTAAVPR